MLSDSRLVSGTTLCSCAHHECGEQVTLLGHLALLLCDGGLVLGITLQQDTVVVVQLFLIQLIRSTHGLQVLLQGVNVSLQPARGTADQ